MSTIKCKCEESFTESQFIRHFSSCGSFKSCFKNFDMQFGDILKTYSEDKQNLFILRILLKQYTVVLEKKIRQHFGPDSLPAEEKGNQQVDQMPQNKLVNQQKSNTMQPDKNKLGLINNKEGSDKNLDNRKSNNNGNNFGNIDYSNENKNIKRNPYEDYSNDINYNPNNMDVEDVSCCQMCKDPNFTYLECIHEICNDCFKKMITENLYASKCKTCGNLISAEYIKSIIGKEKYNELDRKQVDVHLGGGRIIKCVKCSETILFEKGNVNYNEKDSQGVKMSRISCEEYANNRCRCPSCKNEFCVSCQSSPYHIGKSCEDHKKYVESKKCKYCEVAITKNNKGPSEICCNNQDCEGRYKESCKKKLPCGHDCFGHCNEKQCPPCLNKECKSFSDQYNQNSEEFCTVCFTEGLGAAPLVKAECKHYYHYHCIQNKLKAKWVGPKITFNYSDCPQCKAWLSFPNNPDLKLLTDESTSLYESIKNMIMERMKFEGLDKDKRLSDPNDPFYQKPMEFGFKSIAYYMCHKCKKPYFAGMRNCMQDDNNRQHDPTELICGGCGALDGVAGVNNCKKHGKDFIEYKCKFCCEVSSWFCWGTTHFCEPCHSKQCKGEYVTKIPKDKLPKCPGKNNCCLKIDHPPNGEEFALGCSLCKNEVANFRKF